MTTTRPPEPLPPAWQSYVDGLAEMVREVELALAEGRAPLLHAPAQPAGTPPAAVLARRDDMVSELAAVADRLAVRRDAVRSELALLAPPRPRGQGEREADLGSRLDLVG
jgi:hypothetical protein